ncbi:MAG: PAS domain-containing sensor histidine kinase [Salinarimonadaceae bacterium]|nr:MAG: PAS domain-containing sensor histidine kinase [Salinarimonadaceae bacterium]
MLLDVWNSAAGGLVAIIAALALVGVGSSLLLLREHFRIERRATRLEDEIETLQDRLWTLSESEALHRSLVEAQLDVIVRRDGEGRITFANSGYAALVGRPRNALIGARTTPHVVETGQTRLREDGARLVDEAIDDGEGVRWFAWIETPVQGRAGAPEILRAGREITERVVTERALANERSRAQAANEAKSRFLATVSHEFRTPLNGILGMTDLLLDTPLDLEQQTYLRAVKTSGGALLSLIDEILDFSKIEAGKLDLSCDPFDARALIEGVVELLAPRAQGKGVEIACFVDSRAPRLIVGDPDRLRQVLVNLAGNAVKFTETGGVGIEADYEEGALTVQVTDTGPGIPPDRLASIFEEFEQGDGGPASKAGGAGLGLAISRRIVERMGGTIAVDSAPGAGARFSIRLPLPADEAEGRPETAALAPDLAGRRYLVLARSPFEGPYVQRKLAEAGAQAVLVADAADALAKISTAADAERPFSGLIVDCALGDDVARDIAAAAREAGVERRIVLLSPFERRDLGSPSAAGFDAYLVKPLRARSLFERLTEIAPPPRAEATPRMTAPRRKVGAKAKRVLLAEDNEINALLAIKALERLGAVVDWAKDGHEAFSLAEASFSGLRPDYDIVLMDIRMPGLDGLEATRRVRRLEATLGRPQPRRIIALTANAQKEDEQAALSAGLDGFLAKPFDIKDLTGLLMDGERGEAVARAS